MTRFYGVGWADVSPDDLRVLACGERIFVHETAAVRWIAEQRELHPRRQFTGPDGCDLEGEHADVATVRAELQEIVDVWADVPNASHRALESKSILAAFERLVDRLEVLS